MYRSFTIKNFRCFDELTVEGMGRINLIAGKNNVGKTALLEALWVHSGGANPNYGHRLDILRGIEPDAPNDFYRNLFFGFDQKSKFELSAQGDWGVDARTLTISLEDALDSQVITQRFDANLIETQQVHSSPFHSSGIVRTVYSHEDGNEIITKGRLSVQQWAPGEFNTLVQWYVEQGNQPDDIPRSVFLSATNNRLDAESVARFSNLEVSGEHGVLLEMLQKVEPNLERLTVLVTGREPRIYADLGTRPLVPLQLMGAGMSRILSVGLAIATCPGGIVLIDEIENGLHYTVMERAWRAIGAFARSYDVQLFATTHSRECVYYAHRAFEADEEEELRLFRIDRKDGKTKVVMYDCEILGTALEAGLGIR